MARQGLLRSDSQGLAGHRSARKGVLRTGSLGMVGNGSALLVIRKGWAAMVGLGEDLRVKAGISEEWQLWSC